MKLSIARSLDCKRNVMIREHLRGRGIRNQAVIETMREVPREAFIDEDMVELAYEDYPLAIAGGQTISQPYIVAYMTEVLELYKTDQVLEIGTGSGYAAAVLSRIVTTVYSVERLGELAQSARERLRLLG